MKDLYKLTIHEANSLLRSNELSSMELTTAVIKRVEQIEGKIKAFTTFSPDIALKDASEADSIIKDGAGGQLTGIPMQIKDNMCTKGMPTTCSSRMLENFTPIYNATVIDLLDANKSVLMGKGNMDEFAMGSSTENSAFHPTHNPWNLDRVPGGSSGGPAAAVAAGECLFALGSDTGGSIRQPAALCGIVGLKPTYGLVSRYGLIAFGSSLDQIGPLTRDVRDSALVLTSISGYDPRDSTSINTGPKDYTKALKENLKGLKIGLPKEYFGAGIQPEVEAAVKKAALVMEKLGATVEEISMPLTEQALAVYYIIATSECSANLARYDGVKYGLSDKDASSIWEAMENTRQHGFGPEVKRRIMLGTYALSAGYYDAYYIKALKVRTLIKEEFNNVFNKFDALISPTSPTVSFKLGEKVSDPVQMHRSDFCTIPVNIAGIPSISLPCGFHNELPIGLQITGQTLSEETILRIAYAYEQDTEWHKKNPPI
jgi:aspartyl-tRNA(Asn)/glutamyl-tRNA(Gln) amidotransferase subunit A